MPGGEGRRPLRLTRVMKPFSADLRVPGDKSISHRAVLLGSLAEGRTRIENLLESADVLATVAAVRALGATVRHSAAGGCWSVEGRGIDGYREAGRPLDCRNSGTTARLLTGLLAASPIFSVLTGDRSLSRRPMARVVRPLTQAGATILGRDGGRLLPLAISGRRLSGFEYAIPEASAQVKTALMLAALKAHGLTRLRQTAVTRDHTEKLFTYLGVEFRQSGEHLEIAGPIQPRARDIAVPGDPSSAAFFLVAALMVPGSRVVVRDVCLNPTRTGFVRVLQRMGARLEARATGTAAGETVGDLLLESGPLAGVEVEAAEIPSLVDEVPILAVAAAAADGPTAFRGVDELRAKESNRLSALVKELSALGVAAAEVGDDLIVRGPARLVGAAVDSHGDHRMAMALSVAALAAAGETVLAGPECVRISFPGFYELLATAIGN